ncbi:MBL fold metallo-hydrolase [Chryseobacterium phosphatilyticum]|uniref:MBL fold metallo-hydrolase n=2 Tax=Chryseobacterium phosphatilyticum TaxID=475075 RepID=A0A316XCU4_9FLAO|nr:MBL fold metallo-hydrolase [Chryseobacterium phosphatilyticum]
MKNPDKLSTPMKKLCTACGTQFPEHYNEELCAICNEERQYIPVTGQTWTTHDRLLTTHTTNIVKLNDHLYEITITPGFAIGQRAFLVISKSGNILWDCVPLLDQHVIDFINEKGGLQAIAISHPHYYSNMNDWAEEFKCSLYIHKNDEQYISEKGNRIKLWEGDEMPLWDDIKIVNIGGHFAGSSILLHKSMSEKGTLLSGDTMYLSPNLKHFAIMYSYPNRIPLPVAEIKRIKKRLEDLEFDAVYGFYSYQNLTKNVKQILNNSIEKYLS